jgi:hypothetical protein
MKLPALHAIYEEQERLTPEKALWLAVIERGMRDYCFYFEWIQQHRMSHDAGQQERLYSPHRTNYAIKSISEYNKLRWFVFSDKPREYNMIYIFEMIDGSDALLAEMRRLCKAQFKLHLDKVKEAGMFPFIVQHVLNEQDFDEVLDYEMEYRQPSVKARMRIT